MSLALVGLKRGALLGAVVLLACGSESSNGSHEEPGTSGGDTQQNDGNSAAGAAGMADPSSPPAAGAGNDDPAPVPVRDAGSAGAPPSSTPEEPDAGSAGAPVQPPVVIDPPMGGPGCGAGSLCLNLRNAYAELIAQSTSCSAQTPNACSVSVPGSLGCGGCAIWVNPDGAARLGAMAKQFADSGCGDCVYGSPTGDRCHPTICADSFMGVCSAAGMCENQDPVCPDAAEGKPCTGDPIYCSSGGVYCICFLDAWSCTGP